MVLLRAAVNFCPGGSRGGHYGGKRKRGFVAESALDAADYSWVAGV
jgi:hypothetical protein